MKARLLLSIFRTFLKMGPFTFGGGYALIPVIEREIVEKRRWLDKREVADIVTAAASVPGAVGVNSAARKFKVCCAPAAEISR
jgi:chromate transporter